ncbi:MAG: MlaE family lipid ABC transporter permease subunit [Candidatus Sumerlaeota bacterium]|nr:MlaE family lipid ABC transporter permease subunit [Candidatus Sumerlaeota bacterium]
MSSGPPVVLEPAAYAGRRTLALLREMGRIGVFAVQASYRVATRPWKLGRVVDQVHFIGMKSLFIVGLTALFTGMVLGLQLYYVLVKLGSETVLGAAVALALVRELGPVLTALMVTGRAGSSMAAEIGVMRISEQIDALDTMDIDPIKFLVSPRLLASLISFPLLTAFFDCVGIFGGYLTGVVLLGVNSGIFFNHMGMKVEMQDVSGGFIKSLVFGAIVSIICCYQGYMTHLRREGFGARGVSYSTTTAVVMSSVLVLAADYVLTSFLL